MKHYLQDVGLDVRHGQRPARMGHGLGVFLRRPATRRRLLSFGFALSPWQTVPYIEYPSVGRFEGDRFDPTTWKPQTPTDAYMELRADDAFWAARRVMAFTDELIRAAVTRGSSAIRPPERHLADVLIKRRDAIGRAYLPAVNPVVDPRLDADGTLTFDNAAVAARVAEAPTAYRATWSRFDNATGADAPDRRDAAARRRHPPPPAAHGPRPGSFVEVDVAADSAAHPAWQQPVRTYFRRTADGWKLVGLERLPANARRRIRQRAARTNSGTRCPRRRIERRTARTDASSVCSRRSPTSVATKRRARCS